MMKNTSFWKMKKIKFIYSATKADNLNFVQQFIDNKYIMILEELWVKFIVFDSNFVWKMKILPLGLQNLA